MVKCIGKTIERTVSDESTHHYSFKSGRKACECRRVGIRNIVMVRAHKSGTCEFLHDACKIH